MISGDSKTNFCFYWEFSKKSRSLLDFLDFIFLAKVFGLSSKDIALEMGVAFFLKLGMLKELKDWAEL